MAFRSAQDLNTFNQTLRANPAYQQFLRSMGVTVDVPAGQPWRLSDQQRKQAEAWVRRNVQDIGNLEIDPSGNANQNEGFSKYAKDWKTYAAIGGGLTGLGAFGVGPMAGLFGSGAAAAPAASGSLTEGLMSAVPASISSQGVSAGLGAGAAAGGLGTMAPAAALAGGGATALDKIRNALMSTDGLGAAASIAAALAGSRGDGTSDQTRALEEQASRNAAITEARMRRVDPLHEAAVQLAFGRLPVSSRNGIALTRVPLPG